MTDPATDPADRLYTVPPRQFVTERTAAVSAARAAGDASTASALAALRRPTVAAWLVNLLALRRPELLADLDELATAVRTAQQELAGEQLRELATRRRQTVATLVATARSLARETDPAAAGGALPLAEVETTLTAALADPEVARTVRSGRLTRAVTTAPTGELPRAVPATRLRLVTGGTGASVDAAADSSAEAAAAELAAARAAAAAARAEQDQATAAQQEAKRELAEIETALAELADRRAGAAERLAQADAAGLSARRAVKAARRRVGEAEAAITEID